MRGREARIFAAALAFVVYAGVAREARAERAKDVVASEISVDHRVVVWPTLTPAGDGDSDGSRAHRLHKPLSSEGAALALRAQELDATLRDAVQDLGFTLDVSDQSQAQVKVRDLDLVERASRSTARSEGGASDPGTWVVSARLEPDGHETFVLRIVAVPPKSKQLRVRVERVASGDIAVRGLVMLRDLLTTAASGDHDSASDLAASPSAACGVLPPLRSPGRAVLAVNAALFGAFSAYSVQRASGSDDPRLLYPLVTLGTGIGLGGALLVAEEWNVSTGDAWTLAGAAFWGAASGIAVANGRQVEPLSDRYAWGVGGGLAAISLATLSLTRGHADEGDATLVHSGATVGLGLGALSDFFEAGSLERRTPYSGAGYGSAVGLVAGGAIASFAQVSPSRVLLVDLGVGAGAAGGASLASPLLFENVTQAKTRGFLVATASGMVAGGALAWFLTREHASGPEHASSTPRAAQFVPFGGVIGASATARNGEVPAYGAGLRGVW